MDHTLYSLGWHTHEPCIHSGKLVLFTLLQSIRLWCERSEYISLFKFLLPSI